MKKMLFMLMVTVCMGAVGFLPVQAKEETGQEVEINELNQVMTARETVEAKEMPDDTAETVITFEEGAPVYVLGETPDGWYKVLYQNKEGYVRQKALSMQKLNVENLDTEELDREMEAVEVESKLVVEEVERYRAERKRSKIWGAAIILLVAGIFAAGIISTVRGNKDKGDKN